MALQDRQVGYYTIAIVAILGLLSLLASRNMTVATQDAVRLSVQEQTSTEAFYAAEQVMGQALSWIQANTPTYTSGTSATYTAATAGVNDVVIDAAQGASDSDRTYTAEFWYVQGSGSSVRVFARATNALGSQTVSQWLIEQSLVVAEALDTPIGLAGCFGTINGTPEINAVRDDGTRASGTNTLRLPSSCGTTSSVTTSCNGSDYGKLNKDSGNGCTEPIYAEYTSSSDLWASTFSISEADMRTLADSSSTDNVHWIVTGGSQSLSSYGSATSPIILILEDCPSLPANTEIIGIIFSKGSNCSLQGSGNQRIKGSLIINGTSGGNSINKWNANDVVEAAYISGSDSDSGFSASNQVAFDETAFAGNVKLLPGTWTDTDAN
ncbi:MAG: hypothetical protein O3C15_12675 [Proteobacteria bacterium]|jgi:hypothetical protein|nr:hypothetical protein [Pseudomonadota bacterium]